MNWRLIEKVVNWRLLKGRMDQKKRNIKILLFNEIIPQQYRIC